MAKIFISYRREDSSGYTGRLFDILTTRFGRESVFMDLNTIRGGDDFALVIEESIAHCDVLLAIIGDHWLTSSLEGVPRLDMPGDFVRLEIVKAFKRAVRVVPVLVGKATMPRHDDLPEDLRPLCARQAVELRDNHFREDAGLLVEVLLQTVPRAGYWPWKTRRNVVAVACAAILLIAGLASSLLRRHRPMPAPVNNQTTTQIPPSYTPGTAFAPQTIAPTLTSPVRTSKIDQTRRPANQVAPTAGITGRWKATFSYDWPDIYTESFHFEVNGGDVSGTASLQETDHTILHGKIDRDRLSFMTESTAIRDDKTYQDRRFYQGIVEGDTIRFTLITGSGRGSHTPLHFTATKIDAK